MNTIHVVCSSDNQYVPYCGTLLLSIFENNKSNKVCVHILTENIDADNCQTLQSLADSYGQTVDIIHIPLGTFDTYPMGSRFEGYINFATYYRLLIPSLLTDLAKVIYLDCDMLVVSNLLPLWNLDLDNYAIAGVKDSLSNSVTAPNRLGYDSAFSYYNAGMGVWNLKFLRGFSFDKKVKDYLASNFDKIIFHDQDILNAILHGHFLEIGIKWNLMGVFLGGDNFFYHRNDTLSMENPCIIHFADVLKPWFKECKNPYKELWMTYYKRSPWKNIPLLYKYEYRKRNLFLVKEKIKSFLGTIGIRKYFKFNPLKNNMKR